MFGLITLAMAYVLSQFFRSFLAVLTPQLVEQLGADKADLSLAAGLWFVTFGIMQFLVGPSLDKYGPRRTAAWIFGIATTSGAMIFASAQSPGAIVVAMSLIGIGCSPVLMATLYIFAQRFDMRQFAVMTSWFVAFGNLGNVIGASPLATAVDSFGWRSVMFSLGCLTLLIAVAIFLLLRDPDVHKDSTTDQTSVPGLSGYITLLKMPTLWTIMLMTLLCYAPVAGIRGLWAGPYLTDLHGADSLTIGRITLWMAMAMIAGSLLYGPLDKLFNTRKWVIIIGNFLVLCALLVFVANPEINLTITTWLFVMLGICGTSYGVLMAHGRAFLPPHLIGRGVTLLNFCSIAGAGIMQLITGHIVKAQADTASPETYQILFGTYALLLFLAIVCYLFSRDAPPTQ